MKFSHCVFEFDLILLNHFEIDLYWQITFTSKITKENYLQT